MNTSPDTPGFTTRGSHADDALLRAVADMCPGWTVLRDCALADGDQGTRARACYALLHPKIGVALLDVFPGAITPGASDRLRRLLDAAGFRLAFGDYPPIVHLCMPWRSLFGLEAPLAREFGRLPPLALVGGDAWVGAAQRVLTTEPPLHVPGQMAAGRWSLPIRPPERVEGRLARQPEPGLRGLAAFWGVTALVFGGGALVLQYLGPPEGLPVVAHASDVGPDGSRVPQAASEGWLTTAYPDTARLPLPPSPIFALWPAEQMPTRLGAARTDAGARETADVLGVDLRLGENRLAPAGAAAPARPQRPPVPGVLAEGYPAPVATVLAGMDAFGSDAEAADGAPDPSSGPTPLVENTGNQSASEAPFSPSRALLPGAPARMDDGGPDEAPAASAAGGAAAATADTPALTEATSFLSVAAAARVAEGLDASPLPHLGAAAPAQASGPIPAPSGAVEASPTAGVRASAHADPQSAWARGDRAGADVLPRPAAAEPAAVADTVVLDAPPRAPGAPMAQEEDPAFLPLPAAEAGQSATAPLQPSALPPRAAQSAAFGPAEAATPSSPTALAATPDPFADEAASRPDAAPASVMRRDATLGNGPLAERGLGPANPVASVPATRPATPDLDSKAPVRVDETERRAPAASAPPALIEALVARGDAMVARRDVSAARLLYERAATGDARAAAALARTYDPVFLAEIGARGVRSDAALAAAWYRKAISLGDSSALARAEALNGPDRAAQGRP